MRPIRDFRTILGTVTTPFNGWLLLRSLETVSAEARPARAQHQATATMATVVAAAVRRTLEIFKFTIQGRQVSWPDRKRLAYPVHL